MRGYVIAHIYQTIFPLLASKATDNLLKILNKNFISLRVLGYG